MGSPRRLRALMLAGTLGACGDPEPTQLSDCARLSEPAAQEACRYRFIAPLLDDPDALDAALATIDDPGSRDLVLLRLAIADPRRAAGLCRRVTTEGAQARCRQVLGRPHLQSTRRPPEPAPQAPPP